MSNYYAELPFNPPPPPSIVLDFTLRCVLPIFSGQVFFFTILIKLILKKSVWKKILIMKLNCFHLHTFNGGGGSNELITKYTKKY